MVKIGVLEVALAVMLLSPRTAFIGAILLTGYLVGATVTHLRVDDPFFMPIFVGIVIWAGLACGKPEIFSLAAGRTNAKSSVIR